MWFKLYSYLICYWSGFNVKTFYTFIRSITSPPHNVMLWGMDLGGGNFPWWLMKHHSQNGLTNKWGFYLKWAQTTIKYKAYRLIDSYKYLIEWDPSAEVELEQRHLLQHQQAGRTRHTDLKIRERVSGKGKLDFRGLGFQNLIVI